MYRFYINNIENDWHYYELARVFLSDDEFEIIPLNIVNTDKVVLTGKSFLINASGSEDRDVIKMELYKRLCRITGRISDWGILTGVRPLKLALEIYGRLGSIDAMKAELSKKYAVSEAKINLLAEIAEYQLSRISDTAWHRVGIYIGIPFCPTRCSYCAFASNVGSAEDISLYLDNLIKEISYMGSLMREHGTVVESVYIGGGTPTTLNAKQLDLLIRTVKSELGVNAYEIEFTVEAGRPDTITADKLAVLTEHGISRISINPQTMKDETLRLIGRAHTADDIRQAYALAADYGFRVINADLIAGLPEETLPDFKSSLEEILTLGANNITIHTLSVKRGSLLREDDPEFYRINGKAVHEMLDYARDRLMEEGFVPYYIYRQKHQIGALENVGYCRPDTHSIYNIRIMEEKQTIIGLGAGAIGKVYFPEEDRLERIANVSSFEVYNERFDEMLERKNDYYGG